LGKQLVGDRHCELKSSPETFMLLVGHTQGHNQYGFRSLVSFDVFCLLIDSQCVNIFVHRVKKILNL
jgi:hypothetical protein